MRHFARVGNMDIKIKEQLQKYINKHFIKPEIKYQSFNKERSFSYSFNSLQIDDIYESSCKKSKAKQSQSNIDEFINIVKDKQTFSEYLFNLIDESGESDADIYNRAGIDRRLFSKIRSNTDYQPSKNTIFALAMSLKLDHTKTSRLLNKAGYEFSNNKLTDIIIMFCIENHIYDLYQVDSFLVEYTQKPIASGI